MRTMNIKHYTSVASVTTLVAVPGCDTANTMLACDSGCNKYSIGSVAFGSRRFNISLDINVAETLRILLVQLFRKKKADRD